MPVRLIKHKLQTKSIQSNSYSLVLAPSRHLNRPKPWAVWPDGQDRSATTVIPSFHLPQGTLNSRAATLPEGYYYAGMDGTLNSHFSDRKSFIQSLIFLFNAF